MNASPFNKIWDDLAARIYQGDHTVLDESLVKETADQLTQAITSVDLSDNYGLVDDQLINRLRNNVQVFSGFKTYHQLKQATHLLVDDQGALKPFSEFRKDIQALSDQYNVNWLRAEYNHAVGSAQMASNWQAFQATKGTFKTLTYHTANDERVRQSHAAIEGVTRNIDDQFWSSYYPPNGWGCRCTVTQGSTRQTPVSKIQYPDVPDMFLGNVAKDGVIFPESHPFFKVAEKHKTTVISELDRIFKGQKPLKATKRKPATHPMQPDALADYPHKIQDTFWDQFDEKPVFKMAKRERATAYFDPNNNQVQIAINKRWHNSKWYQERIIYHEGGRHLHYHKKWITEEAVDPRIKKAFNECKKLIKGREHLIAKHIDEHGWNYKDLHIGLKLIEEDMVDMAGNTSDTLAALTKGKFGHGHRKSYWKQNHHYMEFLVHGFEHKFASNVVLTETMPEVAKILSNLVDELFEL